MENVKCTLNVVLEGAHEMYQAKYVTFTTSVVSKHMCPVGMFVLLIVACAHHIPYLKLPEGIKQGIAAGSGAWLITQTNNVESEVELQHCAQCISSMLIINAHLCIVTTAMP